MKSDKKFKNAVKKAGDEIKGRNKGFYEGMIATYYSTPEAIKKPVIWKTRRFMSAMAACFAVVLFVASGLIYAVLDNTTKGGNDIEINLPTNAKTVESIDYTMSLDVQNMNLIQYEPSLVFGNIAIVIDGGVEIYEEIDSQTNLTVFYYLTDATQDGAFYRIQLILDENYQYNSQLNEKTATQSVKNKLSMTYSVVYCEFNKTVYYFS